MAERGIKAGAVFVVAAVWASLGAIACTSTAANPGGDSGVSGDLSAEDAAASCQTGGLPTDTYAPNLPKAGKPASGTGPSGGLTLILESDEVGGAASPPIEPYINVLTFKLVDSSGQPVTDATVTLPTNNGALGWQFQKNPWMPLHGHGATVSNIITNNMDGTWSISTDFFMAGLWQIYIVAETAPDSGDPVTDSFMYSFCLQ